MRLRNLLAVPLALALGPLSSAQVQAQQGSITGWGGLTTDNFEDRLPFAPQVGLRVEGTLEGHVWLGVEATSRFIRSEVNCPGIGIVPCVAEAPWRRKTIESVSLRIEFNGGGVRPYLLGLLGRERRHSNLSSTVLGGGFGLLWPEAIGRFDLLAEMRHRDDDRFTVVETDHWELMVGMRWAPRCRAEVQ